MFFPAGDSHFLCEGSQLPLLEQHGTTILVVWAFRNLWACIKGFKLGRPPSSTPFSEDKFIPVNTFGPVCLPNMSISLIVRYMISKTCWASRVTFNRTGLGFCFPPRQEHRDAMKENRDPNETPRKRERSYRGSVAGTGGRGRSEPHDLEDTTWKTRPGRCLSLAFGLTIKRRVDLVVV